MTADRHVNKDSVQLATIAWERGKWEDSPGKYSPQHLWHFAGGVIASSHMLTWLEIALGTSYLDSAHGS